MPPDRRQFTLRWFLLWVLLLSVLVGVAVHFDRSTPVGFALFLAASRLLIVCVVGAAMGVLTGRLRRVLVAMTIGITVADVLVAVTGREPVLMLYNPLVLMAIVACSSTMVKNRARSLWIGLGFSVIAPILVAALFCIHTANEISANPDLKGGGLATVVVLGFAAGTIVSGIVVTIVARLAREIALRAFRR